MISAPRPSSVLHGDEPAAASPQALVDRQQLALIAVERTRMPMVVTDPTQPDNPIVLANQAFLQLSGCTADEVIGRNCRFLQGDQTSQAAVAEIRAAIAEEREASVELLNYRKNGERFWNQLHLSPIHDDAGRLVYFFASQKDVSDQRRVERLEATEHRLLREVDHRTLNTLAIVEGIVRLSCADDAAAYAASVQRRVHALAQTHAMLARAAWSKTSLRQLIQLHVAPYGAERISIEGLDVALSPEIAQAMTIVIHEMAANAAVHGAMSDPAGELQVKLGVQPGGLVLMSWSEQGRSLVQPGPSGFGWTMIKLIVERRLKGQVRQEWGAHGVAAEFTFPATEARQASFA